MKSTERCLKKWPNYERYSRASENSELTSDAPTRLIFHMVSIIIIICNWKSISIE